MQQLWSLFYLHTFGPMKAIRIGCFTHFPLHETNRFLISPMVIPLPVANLSPLRKFDQPELIEIQRDPNQFLLWTLAISWFIHLSTHHLECLHRRPFIRFSLTATLFCLSLSKCVYPQPAAVSKNQKTSWLARCSAVYEICVCRSAWSNSRLRSW